MSLSKKQKTSHHHEGIFLVSPLDESKTYSVLVNGTKLRPISSDFIKDFQTKYEREPELVEVLAYARDQESMTVLHNMFKKQYKVPHVIRLLLESVEIDDSFFSQLKLIRQAMHSVGSVKYFNSEVEKHMMSISKSIEKITTTQRQTDIEEMPNGYKRTQINEIITTKELSQIREEIQTFKSKHIQTIMDNIDSRTSKITGRDFQNQEFDRDGPVKLHRDVTQKLKDVIDQDLMKKINEIDVEKVSDEDVQTLIDQVQNQYNTRPTLCKTQTPDINKWILNSRKEINEKKIQLDTLPVPPHIRKKQLDREEGDYISMYLEKVKDSTSQQAYDDLNTLNENEIYIFLQKNVVKIDDRPWIHTFEEDFKKVYTGTDTMSTYDSFRKKNKVELFKDRYCPIDDRSSSEADSRARAEAGRIIGEQCMWDLTNEFDRIVHDDNEGHPHNCPDTNEGSEHLQGYIAALVMLISDFENIKNNVSRITEHHDESVCKKDCVEYIMKSEQKTEDVEDPSHVFDLLSYSKSTKSTIIIEDLYDPHGKLRLSDCNYFPPSLNALEDAIYNAVPCEGCITMIWKKLVYYFYKKNSCPKDSLQIPTSVLCDCGRQNRAYIDPRTETFVSDMVKCVECGVNIRPQMNNTFSSRYEDGIKRYSQLTNPQKKTGLQEYGSNMVPNVIPEKIMKNMTSSEIKIKEKFESSEVYRQMQKNVTEFPDGTIKTQEIVNQCEKTSEAMREIEMVIKHFSSLEIYKAAVENELLNGIMSVFSERRTLKKTRNDISNYNKTTKRTRLNNGVKRQQLVDSGKDIIQGHHGHFATEIRHNISRNFGTSLWKGN